MNYEIGDIVLVRGQRSNLFEINKIDDSKIWVTNGHIQVTRSSDELVLICKASDRQDERVPATKWFK